MQTTTKEVSAVSEARKQLMTNGKISKELELELVALKLKQEHDEAKQQGLRYETHEEVKKRYGFNW